MQAKGAPFGSQPAWSKLGALGLPACFVPELCHPHTLLHGGARNLLLARRALKSLVAATVPQKLPYALRKARQLAAPTQANNETGGAAPQPAGAAASKSIWAPLLAALANRHIW